MVSILALLCLLLSRVCSSASEIVDDEVRKVLRACNPSLGQLDEPVCDVEGVLCSCSKASTNSSSSSSNLNSCELEVVVIDLEGDEKIQAGSTLPFSSSFDLGAFNASTLSSLFSLTLRSCNLRCE